VLDPNRDPKGIMRGGLAVMSCAMVIVACGETLTQVSADDVVELRLSADSAEVAIGREVQIRAYPLDARGALLVGQQVSWQSADVLIATVDDAGAVTGVATGMTEVIAHIGTASDTTFVTVDLAPVITLSSDSVGFEVAAGGADPAPESVDITNTGGLTLAGLRVDSIVYGPGASDWVAADLDSPVAPSVLELTPVTSGITAAAAYSASLWLSATGADGSPAELIVTLEVAPGPPSSDAFQIVAGNNQTVVTGSVVTTAPTILLRDAFDNPVPGATITFSASGGGSVDPSLMVTDANGQASTSWTLSATGHTMGTSGTFQNTLTASATGLTPLQFVGHARYSFATHVSPIFPASCSGCHGNFVFSLSHATLVDVASNCGGAAFPRVSSAGGDTGANASILLLHLTPGATPPCGFAHPEPWASGDPNLLTLEAWIRNGAPNN